MKKILLSIGAIAVAGIAVIGATGAWFTNTETSKGNTFKAGVIDLKIDNESYVTDNDGTLVKSDKTSWGIRDLNKGELFFDFNDLKPGDVGEDTISLHVGTNPAWACMDIDITGTPENGQTEPESLVDPSGGENDGELQDELEFVFWKDDGDNVLETDEADKGIFWNKTLQEISDGGKIALADSQGGVLKNGEPLNGNETYYIGKAWCQGKLSLAPVEQDGKGKGEDNGPLERGTGISCDGSKINDASQTDGVVADVSFSAAQERNNGDFLCNPPQEGTLTFKKLVVGGTAWPSSFTFYINGDTSTPYKDGQTVTLPVGEYKITEAPNSDYRPSYRDCGDKGTVTIAADSNITCTIANFYQKGTLTVYKKVVGGPLKEGDFDLYIDGNTNDPLKSGDSRKLAEGAHTVSEGNYPGYAQSFGDDCPYGNAPVLANANTTCTVINTYTLGKLTVKKVVVGGPLEDNPAAFAPFKVGDEEVNLDEATTFAAGTYTITEKGDDRYTATYSGACDGTNQVTIGVDDDAVCTITNTYNRATLTVDKRITFTNQQVDVEISDFELKISGPSGEMVVKDEEPVTDLIPGTYTVSETKIGGKGVIADAEFDIDCSDLGDTGEVTLAAGESKVCRITNEIAPGS